MINTIPIFYSQEETDTSFVNVDYQIETDDSSITSIQCSVHEMPPAVMPAWLRVKKFDAKARLHKGYYTILYNDSDYAHGLDTSLFIETATMQIMKKEQMRKTV